MQIRSLKHLRLRLLALALAALCLAPVPARGAVAGDIPGTPFEGTAISGTVGGELFDIVYSLNIESGTVLLVTLRGEAGAELGLYAFANDATSVYTDLPLAQSAKPGDEQTISLQFFRETVIYLNVNGRNIDRPYGFQLIVSRVIDKSPPIILAATVPRAARDQNICVQIEAADRISGVQSVAVYESTNRSDLQWHAYDGLKKYCADLDLTEGSHSISIAVRNTIGLERHLVAGTVIIDNTIPVVRIRVPRSGVLLDSRGLLTWGASEAIRAVGKVNRLVVVTSQQGEVVPGATTISSDKRTISWRPLRNIPAGSLLIATLGTVTDQAGNLSTFIEPHIVTRKLATSVSLSIASVGLKRARLVIRVSSNLLGETIDVQALKGQGWVSIKTIQASARAVRCSIPLAGVRSLRAVWAGSEMLFESTSASRSPR
jgi:hypothetical protein